MVRVLLGEALNLYSNMTELGDMYDDMQALDKLYEQLGWPATDPLTFLIEGDKVVIRNLYHEQRNKNITLTDGDPHDTL